MLGRQHAHRRTHPDSPGAAEQQRGQRDGGRADPVRHEMMFRQPDRVETGFLRDLGGPDRAVQRFSRPCPGNWAASTNVPTRIANCLLAADAGSPTRNNVRHVPKARSTSKLLRFSGNSPCAGRRPTRCGTRDSAEWPYAGRNCPACPVRCHVSPRRNRPRGGESPHDSTADPGARYGGGGAPRSGGARSGRYARSAARVRPASATAAPAATRRSRPAFRTWWPGPSTAGSMTAGTGTRPAGTRRTAAPHRCSGPGTRLATEPGHRPGREAVRRRGSPA